VIQKALQANIGTVTSVRKTRAGHLLIETNNAHYSQKLLALTDLAGVSVKAEPHRTLNSCKGVIRCSDLKGLTKDEIVDGLHSQGVTDCFHITVKSDNNTDRRKTNTFILTFNTDTAPAHLNVGYLRVKVDRYIPNPLRCFKCQKFGHSSRLCRNEAVCHRCGEKHAEENCSNAAKCANCSGPHGASSRECPVWLREKEVQKVKAEKNISFQQAWQIVSQQHSTVLRSGPTSAAVVSAAVSAQRYPPVTVAARIKSSSVAVQTDLTWPSGQEMPIQIPNKSIASQTVSPNRLMGGASTASALQMPAAMASSSAAKNDSPGKGPSVHRPSPSASFKKPQKTQSNKADNSGKPKLRRPPKSDSELPTNNRYSPLETEVDNALSDSDSQNPF